MFLIRNQLQGLKPAHPHNARQRGDSVAAGSTPAIQTSSLEGPFGYTQGNGCCVSHLRRPLKSALSILCFPLANMWGVTWYCTRAWTTYNISKQFPNCFQAKVDSLYGSNPFFQPFFFFICRLGNIKVLSKLDPGGANSLGNSWGFVHPVPYQWQSVSGFPSARMATIWFHANRLLF